MSFKCEGGSISEWRGKKGTVHLDGEGHTVDGDIRDAILDAVEEYTSAVQIFVTSVDVLRQLLSRLPPDSQKLMEQDRFTSLMSSTRVNSPPSSTPTR